MRRRRCEATMAGGIKVDVWSAVGPRPWCSGTGGGGAAWLLLVVFGCVVCGSGTAPAAAARGAGARALFLEKWVHPEGAARYSAERRGVPRESGGRFGGWAVPGSPGWLAGCLDGWETLVGPRGAAGSSEARA